MKNTLILSISLAAVCGIASAILAYAYDLTKDAQEKAKMADTVEAMQKIFPDATFENTGDPITFEHNTKTFRAYPAKKDGAIIGYAVQGYTTQGFGGQVDVMVGVDAATDTIRGVLVTSHQETPGLGTQATDRQAQRTIGQVLKGTEVETNELGLVPNAYLDQYRGMSAPADTDYTVVKEKTAANAPNTVWAVTGATITSKAVADAVSNTMIAYKKNRGKITAR